MSTGPLPTAETLRAELKALFSVADLQNFIKRTLEPYIEGIQAGKVVYKQIPDDKVYEIIDDAKLRIRYLKLAEQDQSMPNETPAKKLERGKELYNRADFGFISKYTYQEVSDDVSELMDLIEDTIKKADQGDVTGIQYWHQLKARIARCKRNIEYLIIKFNNNTNADGSVYERYAKSAEFPPGNVVAIKGMLKNLIEQLDNKNSEAQQAHSKVQPEEAEKDTKRHPVLNAFASAGLGKKASVHIMASARGGMREAITAPELPERFAQWKEGLAEGTGTIEEAIQEAEKLLSALADNESAEFAAKNIKDFQSLMGKIENELRKVVEAGITLNRFYRMRGNYGVVSDEYQEIMERFPILGNLRGVKEPFMNEVEVHEEKNKLLKRLQVIQIIVPLLAINANYQKVLNKRAPDKTKAHVKPEQSGGFLGFSKRSAKKTAKARPGEDREYQNQFLAKLSEHLTKAVNEGNLTPEDAEKTVCGAIWLLKKQLHEPGQRGFFGSLGIAVTSKLEKQLDAQLRALNIDPNAFYFKETQLCLEAINSLVGGRLNSEEEREYLTTLREMVKLLLEKDVLKSFREEMTEEDVELLRNGETRIIAMSPQPEQQKAFRNNLEKIYGLKVVDFLGGAITVSPCSNDQKYPHTESCSARLKADVEFSKEHAEKLDSEKRTLK